MLVFDATPLVYLSKAERLDLLARLERDRVVPERVYDEVVTAGREQGYPDARRVERAVEDGVLTTASADDAPAFERLRENPGLSDADAAALALADAHSGTAVMDERYGREVAETEGIPARGTAYLVLSLVKRGDLAAADARATIDAMVDEGWYCSTDLYASIVRKLESLS